MINMPCIDVAEDVPNGLHPLLEGEVQHATVHSFGNNGNCVCMGCSEEYFPDAPEADAPAPKPASKPAVTSSVTDPLAGMNLDARKQALGGKEGATSYFELVAMQLAKTMTVRNPVVLNYRQS